MEENIILEKLVLLYLSIQEEGGIIDLNWCGDFLAAVIALTAAV